MPTWWMFLTMDRLSHGSAVRRRSLVATYQPSRGPPPLQALSPRQAHSRRGEELAERRPAHGGNFGEACGFPHVRVGLESYEGGAHPRGGSNELERPLGVGGESRHHLGEHGREVPHELALVDGRGGHDVHVELARGLEERHGLALARLRRSREGLRHGEVVGKLDDAEVMVASRNLLGQGEKVGEREGATLRGRLAETTPCRGTIHTDPPVARRPLQELESFT